MEQLVQGYGKMVKELNGSMMMGMKNNQKMGTDNNTKLINKIYLFLDNINKKMIIILIYSYKYNKNIIYIN